MQVMEKDLHDCVLTKTNEISQFLIQWDCLSVLTSVSLHQFESRLYESKEI